MLWAARAVKAKPDQCSSLDEDLFGYLYFVKLIKMFSLTCCVPMTWKSGKVIILFQFSTENFVDLAPDSVCRKATETCVFILF